MMNIIHVGDQFPGGVVERVIDIHMGGRCSEYYTYSMEYECLYRLNGRWYMYEECDGQNGGSMTSNLSSVNDCNVEEFAEERKTIWQRRLGISPQM